MSDNGNIVPLDNAAVELLTELERQELTIRIARDTILSYFARQQGLSGNWGLAANRRELVRVPEKPIE